MVDVFYTLNIQILQPSQKSSRRRQRSDAVRSVLASGDSHHGRQGVSHETPRPGPMLETMNKVAVEQRAFPSFKPRNGWFKL